MLFAEPAAARVLMPRRPHQAVPVVARSTTEQRVRRNGRRPGTRFEIRGAAMTTTDLNGEKGMEFPRRRDGQQWMLDWMVKTTGREQNFEYDDRLVPPEAKSYAMIPAVLYRVAAHQERLARSAEEAGHVETALELYYSAVQEYKIAQHTIFEDDNPEKEFFHQRMSECYDRIIALSDGLIERVEIEWEGEQLSGIMHWVSADPDETAPAVLYCPGMDNTKEGFPNPTNNMYRKRGMHVLAIDGPGQGVSNLRKIRVTEDNYERAGSAFIDWLVAQPRILSDKIGIVGTSMGSYWSARIAGTDTRVGAVASTAANYGTKRSIFETASPRFKQVFMYMAGIQDENQFDAMASRMHLYDTAPNITAPMLMIVGEYDPLCPLREAYEFYTRLGGPKEIWVIEDEFHSLGRRNIKNFGGLSGQPWMADFIRDALQGGYAPDHQREALVRKSSGIGPYGPNSPGFWFPERAERSYLP
jgi:alpha-beta hydrolase superfamily lysophospholipase